MFNLIKADLYKLRKDVPFKIITIILMAVVLFFMGMLKAMELLMSDSINTMPDGPGITITSMQSFMLLSVFSLGTLGLFVAIITSMFVGKDFNLNTIRAKIISGNSRLKIYASTLVVNLVIGFILFFITVIESILLSLIFYGRIADFAFIIYALLLCIPLYISFISIATFISVATKSQTLGIVFNALIVVIVPTLITIVQTIVISLGGSAAVDFILSIFPYSQISTVTGGTFFGYLSGSVSPAVLHGFVAKCIISPLIFAAAATVGGALIFRKADIK